MRLGWDALLCGRAAEADGMEVEITGWIAAQLDDRPGYALLTAEPPCCIGCAPRDPAGAVEVFARTKLRPEARALRLRGRLRIAAEGWRYQLLDAQLLDAPGWAGGPRTLSRRHVLAGGPLLCLAAPAQAQAQDADAQARAVIGSAATVDIHSHAGAVHGVRRVESHAPFQPLAAPMRAGGMAVICLAVVSDSPTHKTYPDKRIHPYRDPNPGELYAYSTKSFQRAHDLAAAQNLPIVTTSAGLRAARGTAPSVIIASEGADFTEGMPDRVDEAYTRWQLRHLQLTHYRVNELGDIQTEAPVHDGLTDAGADVIRRCNKLGVMVDVAHGTFDLVKRAASVTSKPLVLSHTSLTTSSTAQAAASRTRLISAEHARLIAGTGGVIGIWPPASRFPSLDALAGGMRQMVDVVGVDHVGLGSDMMGLTGPSIFDSYEALPGLAAALLGVGFSPAEVSKILGGNYLRVFTATLG